MLDINDLLDSWLLSLRGQNKSPHTIRSYRDAVLSYLDWCGRNDLPATLTKQAVTRFLADMLDDSDPDVKKPAVGTVKHRLVVLKMYARWLADEEGFDADGILAIQPPRGDQRVVPHLSDASITALLRACNGSDLHDLRDKALVALFTETGLRADEMLSLTVSDVSLSDCSLIVQRGKGGKGRRVSFSPKVAEHLDRYMRARRRSGYPASGGSLWVGARRNALTYSGLSNALRRRAVAAGIPNFHLHRLRHTAAVRWLRAGGTETGLMAQAGWSSRTMIERYVKSAAEQIAADEFRSLESKLALED